jgi:hypothetical protein
MWQPEIICGPGGRSIKGRISLHLDTVIKELIEEYRATTGNFTKIHKTEEGAKVAWFCSRKG